ncbi:Wzz/FepE/Etk N-terminal domain-containing protein [Streptomyces sp. NPDC088106]|uniref:Wzz/FepE/Etk N-terminal domain-containing protein n=1 Tax=Streptomyces sp. NPDC088106 TaxID=3154867 RepID=UPI003426F4AA
MTTPATAEAPSAAPLVDLQALVVAVRRRRRLWCSLALLGLVLGATVAVVLPPPPTAVTKVLVAHQQDQPNDPGTLIRTDAALLHTTRIAGAALRSLESPDRPEDFMEDYEGRGLTNNLLQITVTGDSDTEAVARAEALADAFVADHVRRMEEAADAEARSLLAQRERMREELAQVNEAIGDGPDGSPSQGDPQGDPEDSANMESLFARRAELTSRITDFGERAAEARVGTPQLAAATQIVDAARVVRHSLPRTAGTNAAIGLVLGLALGLAVAAVTSVVADRPVLRREIAAHLGASVIAELPRRPARLRRRRRTRAARTRLTTSLARTVRGSTEPVSVLELGCARGASLIALDLARVLAEEEPVVVIDGLPGPQLSGRRPKPGDPPVVGPDIPVPDTLPGPRPGGSRPRPADPSALGAEHSTPVPAGLTGPRPGGSRQNTADPAVLAAERATSVSGTPSDPHLGGSRPEPADPAGPGAEQSTSLSGTPSDPPLGGSRPEPADPTGPAAERATSVSGTPSDPHLGGSRPEPADPAGTGAERSTSLSGNLTGPQPGDSRMQPAGPPSGGRRPQPAGPGGERGGAGPAGGLRIGVGSVAPGTAWTDLRYLGTRTVLVVRAGHGSTAWLHTVARQLADQRVAVIGVVLIDPDPRDRTDGTLWDGPHTARRGVSESPARWNGAGPRWAERLPMPAARVPDSDQEAR